MEAFSYWKTVVKDATNFLDQFLALLQQTGIRYCVIGGQGVNAYAEPVVSLDLDIAVAIDDLRHVAKPALRHRILLNFEGEAEGVDTDGIVDDILAKTPETA